MKHDLRFRWAAILSTALSAVPISALGQGPPPKLIVASPIIEREVASGQTFVGTVMPLRKAVVGSAVDGRVVEFPLNEGDRVEKNQVLAQLLTSTVQLELEAARSELDLRKQQLAELENGTRPEEIEQAKARMIAAQARLQYAKARRARADSLFRQGQAMSEEQRDEMVALAVEAEQAFIEAQAVHKLAVAGPRHEQIAQARAQVAIQQATANRLDDQLKKHTIESRFDGYVTAEHTEVGQWVKQGDPVVEVAALDVVEVIAQVVEQYVPYIRVGMEVGVQIPALGASPRSGVVSAIVPQADVQARTFPVKVRIQNEITEDGPLLKSGMYARVTLPTGERRLATLVPKDALVLGGPMPIVFVVDVANPQVQQGKARPVPVELGVAAGKMIQVIGDVQPGQLVAVTGNERLRPGEDVMIQRIEPVENAASSGNSTQTQLR